MFESTTIPVLEQVVNFAQARHGVLAGNLANIDTPGYRTADLSPERFAEQLKEALQTRDRPPVYQSPGLEEDGGFGSLTGVKESFKSILYHDDSDVSLERQVAEISKNQIQHNLALSIMRSQFRLLETAISERIV